MATTGTPIDNASCIAQGKALLNRGEQENVGRGQNRGSVAAEAGKANAVGDAQRRRLGLQRFLQRPIADEGKNGVGNAGKEQRERPQRITLPLARNHFADHGQQRRVRTDAPFAPDGIPRVVGDAGRVEVILRRDADAAGQKQPVGGNDGAARGLKILSINDEHGVGEKPSRDRFDGAIKAFVSRPPWRWKWNPCAVYTRKEPTRASVAANRPTKPPVGLWQ